tara:strand:+ start:66 stop:311 length:246 start_codon:yes stop_codon:yes gene_type:complete
MYKNTINADNTPDSHKAVIIGQIDGQLAQIADDENIDAIKEHFEWVLMNDFYKNELSAEKIASMESYLEENYADNYEDIPS